MRPGLPRPGHGLMPGSDSTTRRLRPPTETANKERPQAVTGHRGFRAAVITNLADRGAGNLHEGPPALAVHRPSVHAQSPEAQADRGSAQMGRLGPETGLATGSGASFLLGCLGCRSGGCFQKIRETVLISMLYGGGSGIRTLDTVSGTLKALLAERALTTSRWRSAGG